MLFYETPKRLFQSFSKIVLFIIKPSNPECAEDGYKRIVFYVLE